MDCILLMHELLIGLCTNPCHRTMTAHLPSSFSSSALRTALFTELFAVLNIFHGIDFIHSLVNTDIHDVSKIPEYLPYLAGHKQNIKAAQAFKGRKARSQKTRGDIIMHFMVQRMKTDNAPRNSTNIRSSFLPPAYAPCVVSLGDLSRVMIKDLRLETHHRGRYLLLRTVTPTDTLTAVMAIVEDEDSNVLMLQLFNQQKELSGTEDLTEGTIIVVKEPYVKVMADGDHGIRVDQLCDVKLIPEFDNLCPPSWRKRIPNTDDSPDSWRLRGNAFYRQTRFHLAIEW